MAKERPVPAERVSSRFAPIKQGKQRHVAYVETLDPEDVIDRIEYQVSLDGGETWRMVAAVTGARAAPSSGDGSMQPPGVYVRLSVDGAPIFRCVVTDGTGKSKQIKVMEA